MLVKCIECGKFLSNEQLKEAKVYFEPDNHFGPEVIEHTGPCCINK